jgi:hypothetical protein
MKGKKLLTSEAELSEPSQLDREMCKNPWNGRCENTDVALYICYKGEMLPICRECWTSIASEDIEWRFD